MLSLDFLAGFTIFLLGLIVAAGMVPGMLAGLQSATIDNDGVAYRTSVILAEDPGWWFDDFTMTGNSRWEGEATAMDRVKRMGLAVSKETPNVLSMGKIDAFFNKTHYQNDPDFYRETVFFSDYPYSFNISLKTDDGTRTLGDPVPEGDHGYIRRTVMVKEPAEATFNVVNEGEQMSTNGTFAVAMNFSELLGRPEAYRVDPFGDRINITLKDPSISGNLTGVRIYRGKSWVPPAVPEENIQIGGAPANLPQQASDNIKLSLEPGFFSGKASETNQMEIRFLFDSDTLTSKTFTYNYTTAPPPPLKPAVLEVAVW
ncbi:hypothetical protein [uncultured Methanofollis sp.]|uniref:hypothetical protein n=1 Tax=uncultured Methanofollis sp. TaxID=262500 RepID=UPI002629B5BA|nr:hypothetical protein [uncultured Methanofollis sp.]